MVVYFGICAFCFDFMLVMFWSLFFCCWSVAFPVVAFWFPFLWLSFICYLFFSLQLVCFHYAVVDFGCCRCNCCCFWYQCRRRDFCRCFFHLDSCQLVGNRRCTLLFFRIYYVWKWQDLVQSFYLVHSGSCAIRYTIVLFLWVKWRACYVGVFEKEFS